jgi:cytosine/adenosine deaminase-related metal-dependent hydrolase
LYTGNALPKLLYTTHPIDRNGEEDELQHKGLQCELGSTAVVDCGCAATSNDSDTQRRLPVTRRQLIGGIAGAGLLATPMLASASAPSGSRGKQAGRVPHRDCIVEAGAALIWENAAPVMKRDVSVRVRNDRIVEVSTGRIGGTTTRVDARNQLLLPGFISGHTHVSVGSYTRAVIEGGGGTAIPHAIVESFDDEAIDDLMAFNLLELIRTGVTTVINQDHNVRRAYSYVRVASRWAARGYPSGMVPGVQRLFPIWQRKDDQVLFDSVPDTLAEIQANLEFGRRFNGAEDGRMRPNMAPHATDTHTRETMAKVLEAAQELGNGISIHLAQSPAETERVKKLWGVTPVTWLEELGAYRQPVFGAHMSGLDLEKDLATLARNNVYFATCPSAGGPGGMPQPWSEALAAGVKSGPAIDTHSNDMIENVKMAVVHGAARYTLLKDTARVALARPTIADAVNGATHIAADVLGRPDLGRIAVGAKADIITIDVTSPIVGSGVMSPRPLWNLLYASGSAVRNVITDGYFQVFNNDFVMDDEARIVRRGGAVVERMYRILEERKYFG